MKGLSKEDIIKLQEYRKSIFNNYLVQNKIIELTKLLKIYNNLLKIQTSIHIAINPHRLLLLRHFFSPLYSL